MCSLSSNLRMYAGQCRSTIRPEASRSQKADGLTICEEQIRKVERDGVALRQCVERLTQLADILGAESAADDQDRDRTVGRALYLEHQRGYAGCNSRSNRKR